MTQQLLLKSQTAAWILEKSVNQLIRSTEFDNPTWLKSNVTVVAGATDPSAGTTACTVTADAADALLLQSLTYRNGTLNRTFSIYIRRTVGTGSIYLTMDNVTFTVKVITGTWARYDMSAAISGAGSVGIKIATSGDEVEVAWAQLQDGDLSAYVATGENRYTITQITDLDYPSNTVRGCAFLDGRFFVMSPEGNIQQSGLLDGFTWAALDFIKSQADPSRGVYLGKINSYIVAFKEWSTEFFYDAANPTGSILSPVQNATLLLGCASAESVQDLGGAMVFLSQTRAGFGRAITMLQGTSPQKISTGSVEKILNRSTLDTVYSWQATVGAHSLYAITLVDLNITMAYDFNSQLWSVFSYLERDEDLTVYELTDITALGIVTTDIEPEDGAIIKITGTGTAYDGWHIVTLVIDDTFAIEPQGVAWTGSVEAQLFVENYFPVAASVRAAGEQYMQDATSGALYVFDPTVYADAVGAIAARIRTPKGDDGTTNNKFQGKVEIVGDKVDSLAVIRWTNDDYQTYSAYKPVDLGVSRSQLRRCGDFRDRAFEILHIDNTPFRLSALELE